MPTPEEGIAQNAPVAQLTPGRNFLSRQKLSWSVNRCGSCILAGHAYPPVTSPTL